MIASGARPVWVGYVAVEDVEASMRAIGEAGGHVHMSREIPGVGRFAMASDPQGALFYVMRGSVEGGVSTAFAPGKLGHCAWNELWTPDQDGAHAFYTALFGWRQEGVMPMGAMGDYCFLHLGETRFGATGGTDGPAHWLPYFTVPSIGAAVEAVKAHGGTVTTGPHEVPGGGHIVMGVDPQGARFALVADQ
jgi:predicted enzyme related to lactoylglutathione lyase